MNLHRSRAQVEQAGNFLSGERQAARPARAAGRYKVDAMQRGDSARLEGERAEWDKRSHRSS
jgi:hypothetical protein